MEDPPGTDIAGGTTVVIIVFTLLIALSACAPVPQGLANQGVSAACDPLTWYLANYSNIEPEFMRNGQSGG